MTQIKPGRPTKMTPGAVSKLEDALRHGATVSEACFYTGISRDTFYRHYNEDEVFSDKMERARSWLVMKAKHNIADAILAGDLRQSSWLLEKNIAVVTSIHDEMPHEYTEDESERHNEAMEQYVQFRIHQHEVLKSQQDTEKR